MKRETRERETETHPGKGVSIEEVSNHQETLALAGLGEVFPPNWEEKLNKAHRLRAKSNSQQKSTPDARTRHQQEGAERRGAGGIA